jgi:hypothetical protein
MKQSQVERGWLVGEGDPPHSICLTDEVACGLAVLAKGPS